MKYLNPQSNTQSGKQFRDQFRIQFRGQIAEPFIRRLNKQFWDQSRGNQLQDQFGNRLWELLTLCIKLKII